MQFSSRNLVGFLQLQISKEEEDFRCFFLSFNGKREEEELERSGFYVNILSLKIADVIG